MSRKRSGVDMVFATMGSNFGDFDNDGYLDFYLATGDPQLSSLVPNRMIRNLGGKKFVDITGSSGTGHLQKGHGVACGDWDRDGNVDIAIEMGGVVPSDQYHNIMFQNPGQGNNSLTIKLVGQKTNRAAIGARIKVVTAGEKPLTVYRHVSTGSSFGANTLEQTIGLGKAEQDRALGDLLAHEQVNTDLSRSGRESISRNHGICQRLSEERDETNSSAQVTSSS